MNPSFGKNIVLVSVVPAIVLLKILYRLSKGLTCTTYEDNMLRIALLNIGGGSFPEPRETIFVTTFEAIRPCKIWSRLGSATFPNNAVNDFSGMGVTDLDDFSVPEDNTLFDDSIVAEDDTLFDDSIALDDDDEKKSDFDRGATFFTGSVKYLFTFPEDEA